MKNTWKKWMAVTCAMMIICPLAVTAASAEEDTVVTVETLKLATPTDLQPVAVPEEAVEEAAEEVAEETVGQSVEETEEEPAEEAATEEVTKNVVSSENETELVDIEEYETPLGIDRSAGKEQKEKLVVTAMADTDVRTRADGLSEIILTLAERTELNVLGVEGDWVLVEIEGEQGYIYAEDLEVPAETEETEETAEEPEETEETVEEAEEEVIDTSNMKVTIFTSRRKVMKNGDPIILTSKLDGFEGIEQINYQWYCDKGNGFEPVDGANNDSFTYIANSETLSWSWLLEVSF